MWNVQRVESLHWGTAYIVVKRGMVLQARGDGGSGGALHFRFESEANEIAASLNMVDCK